MSATGPKGTKSLPNVVERSGISGNVDGMLTKEGKRDDVERSFMGRRQHHRRRLAIVIGAQPVAGRHAPAITRNEAGEVVLGKRCTQVIANPALMSEELGGDHGAHGVTAEIIGPGGAASIAVVAREGVGSARLERGAQYVQIAHPVSMAPFGPRWAFGRVEQASKFRELLGVEWSASDLRC